MRADEMKPGITILVPAGADSQRTRNPYRLVIRWVGDVSSDGKDIAVSGDLQRLDGSFTRRRNHAGRFALLPLEELTIVEAGR